MIRFVLITCILNWIIWVYKIGKTVWLFFTGHDLNKLAEDYRKAIATSKK